MPQIVANGITLEMVCHGEPQNVPVLLVRGLGSQILHWPGELISGLVDAGYYVVTYDNRDAGLSQMMEDAPPYTLEDMAADAMGVLDTLDITAAHVFGISMGGMITQVIAMTYPDRVLSAMIVMSSSGAPDLPGRTPEIEALLLGGPGPDATRDEAIEGTLKTDRVWAGPSYPFDEAERRALIGAAYDRAWRPDGVARQFRAIMSNPDRYEGLKNVAVPTLVIHGTGDALISVEHGRDIADRIPNARFEAIEGMGHDLDGGVCAPILKMITAFMPAAASAPH